MSRLRDYVKEAGRDPADVDTEGRLRIVGKQPEDWVNEVKGWEALGASGVVVETRRGGLRSPGDHIEAIRQVKEVLDG